MYLVTYRECRPCNKKDMVIVEVELTKCELDLKFQFQCEEELIFFVGTTNDVLVAEAYECLVDVVDTC